MFISIHKCIYYIHIQEHYLHAATCLQCRLHMAGRRIGGPEHHVARVFAIASVAVGGSLEVSRQGFKQLT